MTLLEIIVFSAAVFVGLWKIYNWFEPTREDNTRFSDENMINNIRYPNFK